MLIKPKNVDLQECSGSSSFGRGARGERGAKRNQGLWQLRIAGKRVIDLIEEMDSWTSMQHPARRDSSHREESTRRDSNTKQGLSFHPIFSRGKQINAFAIDRSAHYVAVGGYSGSSLPLVAPPPKALPPISGLLLTHLPPARHNRTSLHLWDLEAAKEKEKEEKQYVHVPNRYGLCQSDVSSGTKDR